MRHLNRRKEKMKKGREKKEKLYERQNSHKRREREREPNERAGKKTEKILDIRHFFQSGRTSDVSIWMFFGCFAWMKFFLRFLE